MARGLAPGSSEFPGALAMHNVEAASTLMWSSGPPASDVKEMLDNNNTVTESQDWAQSKTAPAHRAEKE